MPGQPGLYFRPTELQDYPRIARWMAKNARINRKDRQQLEHTLLQQLLLTDKLCRPFSLMAIADGQPVFFLEWAGADLYLTFEGQRLQIPLKKDKWSALADHL